MTKQELQQLYKCEILPENEKPYHFQKSLEASFSIEAYNAICGDKYTLYFDISEGQISSVYFYGIGCALSKASISIMCKNMENLNPENIINLSKKFISGMNPEHPSKPINKKIQLLQKLNDFNGRGDCIKLGWEAVKNHFENNEV